MVSIKPNIHSVTAFAPATCANVAVGFDILGFAFEEIGDYVKLTRRRDNQIVIKSIKSVSANEVLPFDMSKNTASAVIQNVCQELKLETGFSIEIRKGIPLSSGMGGSAASAVAALVAFNAFIDSALSPYELIHYALFGEQIASGQQHADNIVPCIFGGLTLIHSLNPIAVIQLPIPELYCVLIHPHLYVSTKQARAILNKSILLTDYTKQSANLAAFIVSLYKHDRSLLQKSLTDILIEPQRAQFVPGFYEIKAAALAAGALGFSFSGSGPSMFAFAKHKNEAETIMNAMQEQLKRQNVDSDCWISPISRYPAHVKQIH